MCEKIIIQIYYSFGLPQAVVMVAGGAGMGSYSGRYSWPDGVRGWRPASRRRRARFRLRGIVLEELLSRVFFLFNRDNKKANVSLGGDSGLIFSNT